jgi:hypothetical protein
LAGSSLSTSVDEELFLFMALAIFKACIPPIKSAILFSGNGDSQIKLEIPETEREAIKKVMDMVNKVLIVKIEPVEQDGG